MIKDKYNPETLGAASRALIVVLGILLMMLWALPVHGQRTPAEPPDELGLEITLSDNPKPYLLMERGGATVIQRRTLTINNQQAAGDFTGVDLYANQENGGIKVQLWIVYNDLSNQEWWKDKKERALGEYLVREDAPISPRELIDFGIVPFELRVVRLKSRVFQPGEGPKITNLTVSLQVDRLEKISAHYQMTLKNSSGKRVIWYSVRCGGAGVGRSSPPVSRAHEYSENDLLTVPHLPAQGVERDGIKISSVVFDDGTFEGDQMEAVRVLAQREGFKIQSPSVLERVRATLGAGDDEIVAQCLKLEAGLWTIPEAIDKASALERLKAEYPHFDDRTIGSLYESLKTGLYYARNHALTYLGQFKRDIGEGGAVQRLSTTDQIERGRIVLTRLKEDFETILDGAW
jgi:hypothetical protein